MYAIKLNCSHSIRNILVLPTGSVIGTREVQCLYYVKSFNVLPATNCVCSMLSS